MSQLQLSESMENLKMFEIIKQLSAHHDRMIQELQDIQKIKEVLQQTMEEQKEEQLDKLVQKPSASPTQKEKKVKFQDNDKLVQEWYDNLRKKSIDSVKNLLAIFNLKTVDANVLSELVSANYQLQEKFKQYKKLTDEHQTFFNQFSSSSSSSDDDVDEEEEQI